MVLSRRRQAARCETRRLTGWLPCQSKPNPDAAATLLRSPAPNSFPINTPRSNFRNTLAEWLCSFIPPTHPTPRHWRRELASFPLFLLRAISVPPPSLREESELPPQTHSPLKLASFRQNPTRPEPSPQQVPP